MSNSYLDTKFQYYPSDIRIVKPLGDITLYDYLYKILPFFIVEFLAKKFCEKVDNKYIAFDNIYILDKDE